MRALKKHELSTVAKLEEALSKKDNIIVQQAKRIALLEEYVALAKLKKFGVSTEKSPDQQEMFNEVELTVAAEAMLATQKDNTARPTDASQTAQPSRPGRKRLLCICKRLYG